MHHKSSFNLSGAVCVKKNTGFCSLKGWNIFLVIFKLCKKIQASNNSQLWVDLETTTSCTWWWFVHGAPLRLRFIQSEEKETKHGPLLQHELKLTLTASLWLSQENLSFKTTLSVNSKLGFQIIFDTIPHRLNSRSV